MPTNVYECLSCGGFSEFIEGISGGATDRMCKHCGGVSLRRVLSIPDGRDERGSGSQDPLRPGRALR